MDFFDDFKLQDTFQERIALKSIKIDIEKLYRKFSQLNVDFDGLSLNFLWLRKLAREGINEQYPCKSRYFSVLASLSWKLMQIGMGMLPIRTETIDELFSRLNVDDLKRPWTSKKGVLLISAIWTVTAWLKIDWQFANRNCCRLCAYYEH